jgi:hypothetical protein
MGDISKGVANTVLFVLGYRHLSKLHTRYPPPPSPPNIPSSNWAQVWFSHTCARSRVGLGELKVRVPPLPLYWLHLPVSGSAGWTAGCCLMYSSYFIFMWVYRVCWVGFRGFESRPCCLIYYLPVSVPGSAGWAAGSSPAPAVWYTGWAPPSSAVGHASRSLAGGAFAPAGSSEPKLKKNQLKIFILSLNKK